MCFIPCKVLFFKLKNALAAWLYPNPREYPSPLQNFMYATEFDDLMMTAAVWWGSLVVGLGLSSKPQELFELFAVGVAVVGRASSEAHVHVQWRSVTSS